MWREVEGNIQQEQLVDRIRITGVGVVGGRVKDIRKSIFGCIKIELPQSKDMIRQVAGYLVLYLRRERCDGEHIWVFET